MIVDIAFLLESGGAHRHRTLLFCILVHFVTIASRLVVMVDPLASALPMIHDSISVNPKESKAWLR